jgi:hypothetical protein
MWTQVLHLYLAQEVSCSDLIVKKMIFEEWLKMVVSHMKIESHLVIPLIVNQQCYIRYEQLVGEHKNLFMCSLYIIFFFILFY